jgi:4'-phosphopantetheinyl transferase
LGSEHRDSALASALRRVAGRDDIVIERRPSGRPVLRAPLQSRGVSIARRDGLMVAGFSPRRAVGVDLEIESPALRLEPERLAADHFSAGEARAIAALPPAAAKALFLRLWTIKEAALKTTARGIVDGMASPDLSAEIEELASCLHRSQLVQVRSGALSIAVRTLPLGTGGTAHIALAVRMAGDRS